MNTYILKSAEQRGQQSQFGWHLDHCLGILSPPPFFFFFERITSHSKPRKQGEQKPKGRYKIFSYEMQINELAQVEGLFGKMQELNFMGKRNSHWS